MFVYIMKVFIL